MLMVTKRMRFNAAHRLFNPALDEEENNRLFGPCANPLGHGHNYIVEVSVAGKPDPTTGCLIDLKILGDIIQRAIVDKCDHKHLNHQVDFLSGVIPTVENLAERFYRELEPRIRKATANALAAVRVWETENNYAEFRPDPRP